MTQKYYDISTLEQVSSIALELLSLSDNRIFVLYGDLGVGKTTLIKYMCYHLKVVDSVSSPTFSIVNEYFSMNNEKCFHFDLYRLNNIEECLKLGLDTVWERDRTRDELILLNDKVESLRSERDSLINVLSRLEGDMDYVEKVAREDFGMIRKKERVYPLPKSSED